MKRVRTANAYCPTLPALRPIALQPNRADDLSAFAPDIKIASAHSWTVSFQRSRRLGLRCRTRLSGLPSSLFTTEPLRDPRLFVANRDALSTIVPSENASAQGRKLIAALKEALAYCDRAYDSLTDVTAAQMVKLGPNEMPKLGLLQINVIHSTEHYGNLVTYMRMKNIVPPSSEPGFNVVPPKK